MDEKSLIKKIISNSFLKNVLTLLTGTTLAQLVSIIVLPILTRLFTPTDFAFVAYYLAIASVLAIVATGRYELAIMLAKDDKEAINIFALSFSIISCFSIFLFPVIAYIDFYNFDILGFKNYINWFYLLPFSVFFLALGQLLYYWYNRIKKYRLLAVNRVIPNIGASFVSVGAGSLKTGVGGLLSGKILGQGLYAIVLIRKWHQENKKLLKEINLKQMKLVFKKNTNFLYFSLPMGILNSLSVNLLIYMLALFFDKVIVGLYSKAYEVINYPLSFVSSAFTSVFYQKIVTSNNKIKIYLGSFFINLFIGIIIMLPVFFYGEELFAFVLGEKWRFAGKIASLMTPLAASSYAMRSVSNVFAALKLNQITLIWQIIYLITTSSIIIFYKDKGLETMLLHFSIIGSILYLILAIIGYFCLLSHNNQTAQKG